MWGWRRIFFLTLLINLPWETKANDQVPKFSARETSVSGLHTASEAELWPVLNTDCQTGRLFPGAWEEIEAESPTGGVNGVAYSHIWAGGGSGWQSSGPSFPQEGRLDADSVQEPGDSPQCCAAPLTTEHTQINTFYSQ